MKVPRTPARRVVTSGRRHVPAAWGRIRSLHDRKGGGGGLGLRDTLPRHRPCTGTTNAIGGPKAMITECPVDRHKALRDSTETQPMCAGANGMALGRLRVALTFRSLEYRCAGSECPGAFGAEAAQCQGLEVRTEDSTEEDNPEGAARRDQPSRWR